MSIFDVVHGLDICRCVALLDLTPTYHRHRNTTREIFVESLISIKGEAEQALARKVDCSVVSVPDYLGDIDRDAVVAAAADVGFESVQIMRPSEAIRLAYDFGECSGKYPLRSYFSFPRLYQLSNYLDTSRPASRDGLRSESAVYHPRCGLHTQIPLTSDGEHV